MNFVDEPDFNAALARGFVEEGDIEIVRRWIAERRQSLTASAFPSDRDKCEALVGVEGREVAVKLAGRMGLPFVEFGGRGIASDALRAVPRAFVMRHGVCPHACVDGVVHVAVPDPFAIEAIDSLCNLGGIAVVPCLAEFGDLSRAIARHYGEEDAGEVSATEASTEHEAQFQENASEGDGDAPIIALVLSLIREAKNRHASDIHIEPLEQRLRVRNRIDGSMVEVQSLPRRIQLPVVSRLKIMANISIAEKRVPQDGRIQIDLDGASLDLRVSSLPTAYGESIVMRLLEKDGARMELAELGLMPDDERTFARAIAAPDGMVLVTGPTGSGKSTTLHACLQRLNQTDRKIITVEDPVEYQMAGINQVPVRGEFGMTFASALRAMLRQAPNIIMVGEIRDAETAEIAINASLTGHLVFSTLHTNDAVGAVSRLIDMESKPFLVAAALRATVAQRLVRRVCSACVAPYQPMEREWRALGVAEVNRSNAACVRAVGCRECLGTGYRGRLALFEILPVDDEFRALIHENTSVSRLRSAARSRGLRTLREDGVRKVLAGWTTMEEVLSVTVSDRDQPGHFTP